MYLVIAPRLGRLNQSDYDHGPPWTVHLYRPLVSSTPIRQFATLPRHWPLVSSVSDPLGSTSTD